MASTLCSMDCGGLTPLWILDVSLAQGQVPPIQSGVKPPQSKVTPDEGIATKDSDA